MIWLNRLMRIMMQFGERLQRNFVALFLQGRLHFLNNSQNQRCKKCERVCNIKTYMLFKLEVTKIECSRSKNDRANVARFICRKSYNLGLLY